MLKTNISLVKKNESWVPKKEQQIAAIEKHGYTLGKTLGEGAYAKVKLADSKKHNCKVAIKVINKRRAPKDFLKKFLPREVHLMHRLNHPNVVSKIKNIFLQEMITKIVERIQSFKIFLLVCLIAIFNCGFDWLDCTSLFQFSLL